MKAKEKKSPKNMHKMRDLVTWPQIYIVIRFDVKLRIIECIRGFKEC